MRARAVSLLIATASLVLVGSSIRCMYRRGGPFFKPPETVVDHMNIYTGDMTDAILLMRRAAPMLPRDATVTFFKPVGGGIPSDVQDLHYLIAVGQLPRQKVFAPSGATISELGRPNAEWVIALRDPMTIPWYQEVAVLKGGRLYRVRL